MLTIIFSGKGEGGSKHLSFGIIWKQKTIKNDKFLQVVFYKYIMYCLFCTHKIEFTAKTKMETFGNQNDKSF